MIVPAGQALRAFLTFAPGRRVPVGRLAMDRGLAVFEYAQDFIASGLRINPLLDAPRPGPIRAKDPRAFDGLHGVFGDSLPDAWGRLLIDRRIAEQGKIPANLSPLDVLAIIGSRGMGALTYEPESPLDSMQRDQQLDLDALESQLGAVIDGSDTAVLSQLQALGGSSGGARPKVLVAMNTDGRMIAGAESIPDGYEALLVKFRSSAADLADVGPLECAYAAMARAAGIIMSDTRLISSHTGPGYFATKRFDRAAGNRRMHVLSAAGMLDLPWAQPGVIDYQTLLRLTQRVTADARAIEQIVRRMTFNVFAHNRDDHPKQHAFLMDDSGRWTLAPAYDLTYSRGPGGEHYLAVNGLGKDIRRADVLRVAHDYLFRRAHRCEHIVEDVIAAVGDFRRFAKENDVSRATTRTVWQGIEAQLRLR